MGWFYYLRSGGTLKHVCIRYAGAAKQNRVVHVALYPLVKESFQIYYDLAEIMNIFVDRFTDLEVPDCVSVHEIFSRHAKQLDELDLFYDWSKSAGICRCSEYPDVVRITPKKLEVIDEFIRDKATLAHAKRQPSPEPDPATPQDESQCEMDGIKALPPPAADAEGMKQELAVVVKVKDDSLEKKKEEEEAVDFLNLKEDAMTGEEHGEKLALALFDGGMSADAAPKWEAFVNDDPSDWETTLVQTASNLSGQKASFGGGLEMVLLDGMYAQAQAQAGVGHGYVVSGSASSVAGDPFAASLMVPPPSYVQMSDMEKQQRLLEEQQVWQQYAKVGMAKLQHPPPGAYGMMGGYARLR